MRQRPHRFMLISLLPLLATGCFAFGFGQVRAVAVTAVVQPGGPAGGPPALQAPRIHLSDGGSVTTGLQGAFQWSDGNQSGGGSWVGSWPLSFPATLTAQAGTTIDIIVAHPAPPAVVWVAELDSQGVPTASQALSPASPSVPYTLTHSGHYALMVTAQWSYQSYVTYYFDVEVR